MRYVLIIAALVFGLASESQAQQTEFPYTAIVLSDQTKVYSGPGESHYATHDLSENELVEVYRHDPGGWCAIRPPAKSFSLIPETAVKRLNDHVAQVLADGSQAWVGTSLGPVEKPLWQVKLKKNERVAIVGEASWPHSSGKSVVWLQIEPPAGEYRWVRLADLQLPPDQDVARSKDRDYSEPPAFGLKRAAKPSKVAKAPPKNTFTQSSRSSSSISGWKAATRPIPKSKPEVQYSGTFKRAEPIPGQIPFLSQGDVEQTAFVTEEPSDPRFESWDGTPIRRTESRTRPPERFASLDSIGQQSRSLVRERQNITPAGSSSKPAKFRTGDDSALIHCEEMLSKEMLKDPQTWNLADIKFQTERAKARSDDPVERLALQHVLEKVERCDRLRKGYQQASPFSAATAGSNTRRSQQSAGNSTYDATGWLKRLASSSGTVDPSYVLQDSLGNVTHEVAGTVGTNLGRYVDQQVGVIGRRGFNRRLNLNHVTVERVIVLR